MTHSDFTVDCQYRFITKGHVIHVLSEQPATGQDAEETCHSYGGRLAQISNQEERLFLEPHLRSLYIPGCFNRLFRKHHNADHPHEK